MSIQFVCTIGRTDRDYTHLSIWSDNLACDLTSSSTKVFSCTKHTGNTYELRDGCIVHLYSGNTLLNCTATLHHATSTQVLLSNIQGTSTPTTGNIFRESLNHDYVTLTNTGDSVIAVAECYNDEVIWDSIVFDSWVTSSTNYIKIYTPITERHTGKANTGFGIFDPGANEIIILKDVDIIIEGIEFSGGASHIAGDYTKPNKNIYIDSCIFHDNNWGALIQPPKFSSLTIKVWNCILYNSAYSIIDFCSPSTLYIENCTLYNPGSGYGVSEGQCYNIIVHRGGSNYACFNSIVTGNYNCDGLEYGVDNTAPGIYSLHNKSLEDIAWYNSYENIDLHIWDNSILINSGVTRVNGNIKFNTDILGVTREGYYWDIGAFQIGGSSSYSSSSSSSCSSESLSSSSSSFSITSSSSSSFSITSSSSSSSSSSSEFPNNWLLLRDYIQINNLTLRDYMQRGTNK